MTPEPIDHSYSELLSRIKRDGVWQTDRTSVGKSKQLFGESLRFNTMNGFAPLLQIRTMAPRIAFEEWIWMMRGSTDVRELQAKNIHIWDGNSTREFLDSRGLHDTPENHIGRAYGYQYRSFGGEVDQIRDLYEGLKTNPRGRRHVVSIWNPIDSPLMALEPCFHLYEFMFSNGKLNLYVHGRSSDTVFGLPYNLAFSSFWLFTFSRALGYEMGEIFMTLTNAHYYENQTELVDSILSHGLSDEFSRIKTPRIALNRSISSLDDILGLEWSDIMIQDWIKGPKLTDRHIEMAT